MECSRPKSISRWLSEPIQGCACGRTHALDLREVVLQPGAVDLVGEAIAAGGREGPLILIADPDTYDAAGSRASRTLRAAGYDVREEILPRKPRADDRELERLRPALRHRASRVVAVGSGTICDLGKVIAAESAAPLMVVATAASMNGYASSIAALTLDGLKVTRAVPAADIIVLDTRVLAAAPVRMTRAGFGDLCSKPVSSADWTLSHLLLGESLCHVALSMADDAVARARAKAEGIGHSEQEAVAVLAEALVLSGLSMAVAGASSPASGGEHLLSHYLDMSRDEWKSESRLHGEQVAVGTLVSLALYGALRATGPPAAGEPVPAEETDDELSSRHAHLSVPALRALLSEARAKSSRAPTRVQRRAILARRWKEIWSGLGGQLAGSDGLEADLAKAGVPRTFAEIGLPRERAVDLVRNARHMRDRYTILDLAADLGRLDRLAEEIADRLAA